MSAIDVHRRKVARVIVWCAGTFVCTQGDARAHLGGSDTHPDPCAAFSSWLAARLPSSGSVRAVFTRDRSNLSAGFDWATRAWFVASDGKVTGRTPDGREYVATIADGRVEPVRVPFDVVVDPTIRVIWPNTALLGLRDHPRQCVHAEPTPDGGWKAAFLFPGGQSIFSPTSARAKAIFKVERMTYVLNPEGVLQSLHHESTDQPRNMEYDESASVPHTVPGWSSTPGGPRVVRLRSGEHSPRGSHDWFEPEAALDFALHAGSGEPPPHDPPEDQRRQARRDAEQRGITHTDPAGRTGTLVAVSGLILVMIGVAAWYRARR